MPKKPNKKQTAKKAVAKPSGKATKKNPVKASNRPATTANKKESTVSKTAAKPAASKKATAAAPAAKQKAPAAKQKAAAAAPAEERGPAPVTSQLLVNILTMDGAASFSAALDEHQPSVSVLKKTRELLEFAIARPGSSFADRTDLLEIIDTHVDGRGLNLVPSRGRQPPADGDRRRYKIQQLKGGSPFIRLATTSFGELGAKGEEVVVSFSRTGIAVVPRTSAAVDDAELVAEDDV